MKTIEKKFGVFVYNMSPENEMINCDYFNSRKTAVYAATKKMIELTKDLYDK